MGDRVIACASVIILSAGAVSAAPQHVINSGTQAWVSAAQSGRADLLIIGDSMVLQGGNGWDAGYNAAINSSIGLAGTGLVLGGYGQGEGYSVFDGYGWIKTPPSYATDYAWTNRAAVTGSPANAKQFYGYTIDGTTVPAQSALTWDVWTASDVGGGTLGAYMRSATSPYGTIQTIAPTATTGYQKSSFAFAAPASNAPVQLLANGAGNNSILYSRVTVPGDTGATVTSWGYGGKSTYDFWSEQWMTMPAVGRQAFLDAIVSGGSGKLMIALHEGLNDRNETTASATNAITPANSAAAFKDNVSTLIAQIRSDWSASGNDLLDLSFLLVSSYQDTWDTGTGNLLAAYGEAERQLALADAQISYVDLYSMAPLYANAPAGTFLPGDGVHIGRPATLNYSQQIWDVVMTPEPSLGLSVAAGVMLLARRRKR